MKSMEYIAKAGYVKFECECGKEGSFYITTGTRTKEDQAVIEAAFKWRKDMYEGSYLLLKAVEAHPDFPGHDKDWEIGR